MPYMYTRFSEFLVQNIFDWLAQRIAQGHRYRFHSDDEDNIKELVEALQERKTGEIIYKETPLPYIEIKGVKLLYVNDVTGVMNENFISNLRDAVSAPYEEFSMCSLLVLHKSRLDTVLNSAIDLAALDAPLNAAYVKKDLQHLIHETKISKHLKALMKLQAEIVESERQSAFGYKTLFHSIIDETIYFKELSLFEDADLLKEHDGKKIEKRFLDNRKLYDEIENIMINFPSEIEERLANRYSEDFINKYLTLDTWKEVTYDQLIKEINKPRDTIEFDNFEVDNGECILRNESATAAGKRTKNIIVFAEEKRVRFFIKFKGKGLTKDHLQLLDNKAIKNDIEWDYIGLSRTFEVSLTYDQNPLYFSLRLNGGKASSIFKFKILVLQKGAFDLQAIYNFFIVKPKEKLLLLQTSEMEINFSQNKTEEPYRVNDGETVDIRRYPRINYEDLYNNQDVVAFAITNGVDTISLQIEGEKIREVISIPLLYNQERLDRMFHNGINVELNYAGKKAILEYQEIPLIANRFTYIDLEHQIISNELMHFGFDKDAAQELASASDDIFTSYTALLRCFRDKKTTPSLCAWDDEICKYAQKFCDDVKEYLQSIPDNTSLSPSHKLVLKIGRVRHDGKEYLSPFSPLILSYILYLRDKSDESLPKLSEVTLKRLNPKGLFPYLYKGTQHYSYTSLVQDDPLWLEFVDNEENEFSYVSKLVSEKIVEFSKAFEKLFEFRHDAPLIINSINNASNKEIFKGLVKYYKDNFEKKPKHIIVNIYDQSYHETYFDIFADTDSYEEIKQRYNLKENAETIIDIMRTHITYSKHLIDKSQSYAHLSFFKNNEKVQIQQNKVDLVKSGLVCSGLISGESSEEKNGYYYSGFGLRNVAIEDKPHLQMAKLYNALQRPAFESGALYDAKESITLMISENFKTLLHQSYENSLWTVIIDPKVTLDFFDNEKDLILIHYSDQYSSSANYDAITVTAQKEIYADVVGSENIIREFNAFNGEWLIKMIAEKDKRIKREKKGIIAAYKYITAFVDRPDITWVPLSIAELLRVAGNVGLEMSKSDFSRYNEMHTNSNLQGGAISDDILLVGYCKEGIILYPVEVKSGSADLSKAIRQAISLKRFFKDYLFQGDGIKAQLLKGLFIRQIFMQIDKFKLYDVFEEDYFQPIIKEREKLLEGRYKIVELDGYYEGVVVYFNDSPAQFNTEFDTQNTENILVCKLPSSYQQEMLEKCYSDLKAEIRNGSFGTDTHYLLDDVQCNGDHVIEPNEESPKQDEQIAKEEEEKEVEKATEDKSSNKTEDGSKEPMQIIFGTNVLNGEQVIWYPTDTTKTLNTNTGIIGTMGTGKTQFTKSLITQMMQNVDHNVHATPIGILIFDYKGDYIKENFTTPTGAKVLDPYHLPYNPLALFGERPLLPVHTTNLFKTTLAKAFGLGTVQQANLNRIILEAYEKRGISRADRSTWTKLAPTIQDIWEIYTNEEKISYDSLYAALKKLIDFEIFEPDPQKTTSLYDLIDGITVINLSGYDTDIQNLIVAITLDIFYTQMHIQGSSRLDGDFREITKMILVDEADNFMSQDFESLKKILKEGREFGVGTILSTQQLTHFKTSENNYADYLQTWVIHQVSNIKTQDITSIFNISNKHDAETLMEQIRRLEKHYSIYVDGKKNMIKMRDLAFWELIKEKEK